MFIILYLIIGINLALFSSTGKVAKGVTDQSSLALNFVLVTLFWLPRLVEPFITKHLKNLLTKKDS